MKKLFTLSISMFVAGSMFAQTQLSNGSFENWTGGNPDVWGTYGSILPSLNKFAVVDTTSATNGTKSIVLKTDSFSGVALGGQVNYGRNFSYNPTTHQVLLLSTNFSDKPDTLQFDVKYAPVGSDTCVISCMFTEWTGTSRAYRGGFNATTPASMIFNSAISTWGRVQLPLYYQSGASVDSMLLNFTSSLSPKMSNIGTKFQLDNVKFIYKTNVGIIEEELGSTRVSLYPNPAVNEIKFDIADFAKATYELFAINGQKVQSGELSENLATINISNLPNGEYLYKILVENKLYRGKFIVTK